MKMAVDNTLQVLEGYELERIQLETWLLNQALEAATYLDIKPWVHWEADQNLMMGTTNATSFDEYVQSAKEKNNKINVAAMLIL